VTLPMPEARDDEYWDAVHAFIVDESGEVPGPQLATILFCHKAAGKEPAASIPLAELVTPESLPRWDLEEFEKSTAGTSRSLSVRYLSPEWAMILFKLGEPGLVMPGTTIEGLGLFLRYDEATRRWLVHTMCDPNTPVDELSSRLGLFPS
jgi:hypothetical protein